MVDPATWNVITPTPSSQSGIPQAIETTKKYLGQDTIDVAFLDQTDNPNNLAQEVGRYHAGSDDFFS